MSKKIDTDEFHVAPTSLAPIARAPLWQRGMASVFDAVTATVYLLTWVSPFWFGDSTVKNLMLLMLIEFIMVHSGGMMGMAFLQSNASKQKKALSMAGFGLFYLLFIGAFAFTFEAWWPVYSFFWLLLAKIIGIWTAPASEDAKSWQKQVWGFSVAAYLLAVFATTLLWLPRLGIGSDVVPALGLKGGGLWVDQPHTVIAAGFIYFGLMAWFKLTQPNWALKMIK